ncbi:hypothetical protein NKH18_21255 [Streptomyces sp. M10(2022)]
MKETGTSVRIRGRDVEVVLSKTTGTLESYKVKGGCCWPAARCRTSGAGRPTTTSDAVPRTRCAPGGARAQTAR